MGLTIAPRTRDWKRFLLSKAEVIIYTSVWKKLNIFLLNLDSLNLMSIVKKFASCVVFFSHFQFH